MNRSEISNDFNFENQLDISKTRKDNTEHNFSKEGFAFEDFMNIGDRTVNSNKFESKIHQTHSELSRFQQEPSNIIDSISTYSMKRKILRDELMKSNTSHNISGLSNNPGVTPKFADPNVNGGTTNSIPLSPRKQFTLRNNINEVKNKTNISEVAQNNAFKKKQISESHLQKQYKSLQSQIKYYEEETQKMLYESTKVDEQTQNLMMSFCAQAYEKELEEHAKSIKKLNKQIEQERQLQSQLSKMVEQLEEDYQAKIHSLKTSKFPRPTIVKDEAKALIDEINSLKAQLEALQRDDGSLNLSSTLMAPQQPNSAHAPSSVIQKKADEIARTRLSEIYEENKRSDDPRYLINLKMACLKSEWCLYSNPQIQVSVSYRDVPKVVVRVGNKMSKDLQLFSLKHNNSAKLQRQTVAGKSYYEHTFHTNPQLLNELFVRIDLSYQMSGQKKQIVLFVPVGLTTFGQFSPITKKQFESDAGSEQFQGSGNFRPLDKKIVSSVQELTVYMPNLIVSHQNQVSFGLFIFPFEDCELVIFRQRGQMLSVSTKNEHWPLIRLLEFIFTV